MGKEFLQRRWDDVLVDDCQHLIRLAIREDLDQGYDWTTVALVSEPIRGAARVMAREPGVAAGLLAIPVIIQELDADIEWSAACDDGHVFDADACLGTLTGSARDLLTAERLVLNLVGRLTGIASLTHAYVRETTGTAAHVYDTRKTCPGYRRLEKYAVQCGGGRNHRSGLYDAILIKDNHLALGASELSQRFSPAEAVLRARQFATQTLPSHLLESLIIEIEVDTLAQLELVLPTEPDIILLDNMSPSQLRSAVARRDAARSTCELEASGGVNLQTIAEIARTGVERISVGALTHSARCLDIGLDWMVN